MLRLPLLACTGIALLTAGANWWMDDIAGSAKSTEATQAAVSVTQGRVVDEADVQEKIKHRTDFAAFSESVVHQLVQGNLNLHQARDRVMYYCLGHYPDYLQHVQVIEHGTSLKVKLARCLLRFAHDHVQYGEEDDVDQKLITSLDAEFDSIVQEEQANPASASS